MNETIICKFKNFILDDDYESALLYLNSCECKKDDYKILNNIGWLQLQLYDDIYSKYYRLESSLMSAIECLESAFTINDCCLYVLYNLGCAYFTAMEYEKSINAFSTYLKTNINLNVVNKLCVLYGKLHKIEKTEKLLTNELVCKSVKNEEEYFETTLYNLIVAMYRSKKFVKAHELALTLYDKLETGNTDIENLDLLDMASLFFATKDYKKVIEIFPLTSYIYSEKYYGIFLASAMYERKNIEQIHATILGKLDGEIQDILSNNDIIEKNKEALIAEIVYRKTTFKNVYNDVKRGRFLFEIEPKASYHNNCVFIA